MIQQQYLHFAFCLESVRHFNNPRHEDDVATCHQRRKPMCARFHRDGDEHGKTTSKTEITQHARIPSRPKPDSPRDIDYSQMAFFLFFFRNPLGKAKSDAENVVFGSLDCSAGFLTFTFLVAFRSGGNWLVCIFGSGAIS